jgi:hypothetical protein
MRLGIPIPKTLMLAPREYDEKPDLRVTLQRYADLFDLQQLGEQVGYPSFVKPYDGGGWQGVVKVDNAAELKQAYDASGKSLLHLQKGPTSALCAASALVRKRRPCCTTRRNRCTAATRLRPTSSARKTSACWRTSR